MATEYRVEKQNSSDDSWRLAHESGANFSDLLGAQRRLNDLRAYMFKEGTKLRVAAREVGDWVPVPSELERAIERMRMVMTSNGQLGYQDADVRLLIQAVERGEHR